MSSYSVRSSPIRVPRGRVVPAADPPARVGDRPRPGRQIQVAQHIARSLHQPPGHQPGASLQDLQARVASLLKSLGTPPQLHTTDGHPIHLGAAAADPAHHPMSPDGHREAFEVLRQATKLLFHLRDLKRDAGDARGALLFDREARRLLEQMEGHQDIAAHKETMDQHAANAATHASTATALAQQIAGKDQLGLADHEQARTHPLYPRYAAARAAEQRASDGVRHAALAAMGRAGGGAHALEVNQFLDQHGHGAHGVADDAGDARLAHDAEKARLTKTLTGPPSARAVPAVRRRIAEIAARGGKARNAGGRQARAPASANPAQIAGESTPRAPIRKAGSAEPAEEDLTQAAEALERGDTDAMLGRALRAMERALAARPSGTSPGAPDVASRDGDGDGRVDGPDDGDSDSDPADPVRPIVKALARRPLRPDLDLINHRPAVRAPDDRPATGGRPLRRYPDGTLDFQGAKHAVLDALWKLRDGGALTPIETALAQIALPGVSGNAPGTEVAIGRLSEAEKARLTALAIAHIMQIARAEGQRSLSRSASSWTLPEVRESLLGLLVQDPFGLGVGKLVKALALTTAHGGPGSRGGQVAYTTRSGRPVYAAHARRLAPQMDRMMTSWHQTAMRSGDPEHHAIAAKQALAAAFYHHHAGDSAAAEQAMGYADHHLDRAGGHRSRTMRWIEQHHPATRQLLALQD